METESITELMAILALQLGIIFFAVRVFGRLAKFLGIPQVLGELIAGVVIGPYALGGISMPAFPHGIFPLGEGTLAVSGELYAFAAIASVILLFASGLETDIAMFLRYSLAGSIIGLGGVVISFAAGDIVGVLLLNVPFTDPRCMFLGILCTATSVGITARILSDQKKMDSPEGVTILAAAVFDDVLGIVALAVVLGIVAVVGGSNEEGLHASAILAIAGKAFGIWLGFTALGLLFAKKLAGLLKLFKHSADFSILALGVALALAGIFEKHGLAMIIGAYIAGLSLSKTDIAPIIHEHIHGIYNFFVPIFFAVMGMMVDMREIVSPSVLTFGAVYTGVAVLSKIIGCGGPALLLGFNGRGALRIGMGMVPRGEVALIIAGIGLATGILSQQIFGVVILMTLITTLVAPPLLSATLKLAGQGTRKQGKGDDSVSAQWEFSSVEIADMVTANLLKDLRSEGFFVQSMNLEEGISQARKDDIVISISKNEKVVAIKTAREDMLFVKAAVYEDIVELYDSFRKLKESADPQAMQKDALNENGRTRDNLLSRIRADCVSLNLRSVTKEDIVAELVYMLSERGKLLNRDLVLRDVLEREKMMSTGMAHGIALPHGKSDGVEDLVVAIGIKKEGVNFGSLDGEKSRLFILVVSPKKTSGPHVRFLAAISAVLKDAETREALIAADTPEKVVKLLRPPR